MCKCTQMVCSPTHEHPTFHTHSHTYPGTNNTCRYTCSHTPGHADGATNTPHSHTNTDTSVPYSEPSMAHCWSPPGLVSSGLFWEGLFKGVKKRREWVEWVAGVMTILLSPQRLVGSKKQRNWAGISARRAGPRTPCRCKVGGQ